MFEHAPVFAEQAQVRCRSYVFNGRKVARNLHCRATNLQGNAAVAAEFNQQAAGPEHGE
ncbi:MAG: hypothetical protein O9260_13385 [Silanimonas sp.]|nr:hypothetical protein [Silanimonas sp.]